MCNIVKMGNGGIVHGEATQTLLIVEGRLEIIYGWLLRPKNYEEKIRHIKYALECVQSTREKIELDKINGELSSQQARYHTNEVDIIEAKILATINDREIDREGVYIYEE